MFCSSQVRKSNNNEIAGSRSESVPNYVTGISSLYTGLVFDPDFEFLN